MAIFPNVCLWRRSYAQNWVVLTLKNCYSIEPPSYASAASVVASYGPRFFSTVRLGKIRATCENFLGKWFTAPPWQKFPVRLCSRSLTLYHTPLNAMNRLIHYKPTNQLPFSSELSLSDSSSSSCIQLS